MELDVWVPLICDHLVVVKHQLDDHPCVVTVILNNQPIRIVTISWKKLHSLHVKDNFLVKYNLYGDDPHDIRCILCVRVLSVGWSQNIQKYTILAIHLAVLIGEYEHSVCVVSLHTVQVISFHQRTLPMIELWTHFHYYSIITVLVIIEIGNINQIYVHNIPNT